MPDFDDIPYLKCRRSRAHPPYDPEQCLREIIVVSGPAGARTPEHHIVSHAGIRSIASSDKFKPYTLTPVLGRLPLTTLQKRVIETLSSHLILQTGAQHSLLRRLFGRAFSVDAATIQQPLLEAAAHRRQEVLRTKLALDPMTDLALPYTTSCAAALLGIGQERLESFARIVDVLSDLQRAERIGPEQLRQAEALLGFFVEELKHQSHPAGTPLNLAAEYLRQTHPQAIFDLLGVIVFFVGATVEGTAASIVNLLVNLDAHAAYPELECPESRQRVLEEGLRFDTGVYLSTPKICSTAIEYAGHRIPRGAILRFCFGQANHDPNVFAQPERFDAQRSTEQSALVFGAGPHFCLGWRSAKAQIEMFFRELKDDLTLFDCVPEGPEIIYTQREFVRHPINVRLTKT